ncbi:serine/threonine-protein phosphatase [Streptomyces sp. NBC_01476]|uniref:ATP-binding SpoIIE family protein phosphatase n=1 Tax=Streptomyces sp. NBC_01476 TaxID=2903881 RepID=UPI002E35D2AE|nr:ATP-binding SpoIIE family protein phosphatase [Streptomyces sp. NBC_01476]
MLRLSLPLLVLAATALAILFTSPGGHYGLFLAVVPFLAAATHGVSATAVIGALTVGTYALLRYEVSSEGAGVWSIKLGLVAAAAVVGVLLSQARARERELHRSRDTALTLQRGLLPREFPGNSAVETGSRYVPADSAAGVGGDWFDVIPLSGARVALVMGDVVGHGLHAAATMGRMRTAVHTLADLDLAPDELLARMDDLVHRMNGDQGAGELGASCLYMVYDPISRECCIASAGHTPPAFIAPDGAIEVRPNTANPPLGFGAAPFETACVTLPEGTVIALYTDGLLDLRHREADEAITALAAALLPATGSLQKICNRVLDGLPAVHDDDMALLLARTRTLDERHVATWQYPAVPEQVPAARAALTGQLESWGLAEQAFAMELVVTELVTNAVRHARGPVTVRLIQDDALICEVSDGSSTSPHARRAQPLDEGGRGLYLVGQLVDRWGTRYTGSGKTIWAEKRLDQPADDLSLVPAVLPATPALADE